MAVVAVGAVAALLAVLSRKERTEGKARAFLAGFTYVLSDDPDAAIAELSRAVKLDTEALETYFALGALFRRKGDLERAIRLHSNIVLRPGLPPEVKRRAQFALAHDYRRGALKDKAAETLEKILAEVPDHRDALILSRQLLEDQGRWEDALRVQLRLVERDGAGHEVLAHLCAEASRGLPEERQEEAEPLARKGVSLAPKNANALLALGQVLLKRGANEEAGEALKAAVEVAPAIAPEQVRLLVSALGEVAVESLLRVRAAESSAYALALALLYQRAGKIDRAISELQQLTDREPRNWEARKVLGTLLLSRDRSAELRAEYAEILGLGQPVLGFQCGACRQALAAHAFRCPSCSAWDSVVAVAQSPELPRQREVG